MLFQSRRLPAPAGARVVPSPRRFAAAALGLVLSVMAAAAPSASAQCATAWDPSLGQPGFNGGVNSLAFVDVGGAEALYAGGSFTQVGIAPIGRIARQEGNGWVPLGGGLNGGNVNAIVGWDDGTGPALFAAGTFTVAGAGVATRIAKWNGVSWSPLGPGLNGAVRALAVWDDGNGEDLYAAGAFSAAGGTLANRVARWDGSSWSALGGGANDTITALAVYDDGSGPQLFAAGLFTSAGSASASRIARWNGSTWARLLEGLNGAADSLTVHDDGSGESLVVGGSFSVAGTLQAVRVARWNGASWSAMGGGLTGPPSSLLPADLGSGVRLWAAGAFGGFVANWDGASWTSQSPTVNTTAIALAAGPGAGAPALYVGGLFTNVGGASAGRVARLGCATGLTYVPGCGANSADLVAGPQAPKIGNSLTFRFVPETISPGVGFLFFGPSLGPCGIDLLGLGELLIDLGASVRVDLGFVLTEAQITVPFPNVPGLAGASLRAQAVALGPVPVLPPPVELSTAIDFVIAP
ncbi:MAG: hypothetical protein GC161_15770 [Planctomycetaceae bacterium]|nr:hypothetical protein [Planctomycetaceae bacterium]